MGDREGFMSGLNRKCCRMVDLGSGKGGGPLEHAFDNKLFIFPAIVILVLAGKLPNDALAVKPQPLHHQVSPLTP